MCIERHFEEETIIGLFNFSEYEKTAWLREDSNYTELLSGKTMKLIDVKLPPYGFYYLKKNL